MVNPNGLAKQQVEPSGGGTGSNGGTNLSVVRDGFQNYNLSLYPRPDIPLGVFMLAAIHEGYRIRQVKGSYDGRILSRRREVR
jgi:hypothetical protein